jgi:rhamnogalacturonan hydrolase
MLFKSFFLVAALSLPSVVSAQLAGSSYSIGPLTTSDATGAVKVCDVTDYGAVADGSTDIGPPLLAAFNACKTGGIGESVSGPLMVALRLTRCS